MSTLIVNNINPKTGSVLTVTGLVTGSSIQAKGLIAATGSIYASFFSGSGDLIVGRNAFVAGDLKVTGTVITDTLDVRVINNSTVTTTTLEVEDKLIIVASGSTSANTDDAGIQFGGSAGNAPIASILWDHTNQRLSASSALYTGGDIFVDGGDVTIKAGENGAATLLLQADESDDLGDDWKFTALANQDLQIANDKVGAYVAQLTITPDSTAADSVTKVGKLKLAGNVIQASDGGATITLDTSDNVTVAGATTTAGLTSTSLITGSSIQSKGIISATGSLYAASLSGSGDLIVAKNAFVAGALRATGSLYSAGLTSTALITGSSIQSKGIISATGSLYSAGLTSTALITGSSVQSKGIISATGSLYANVGLFLGGTSNAQTMSTVTLPANYNSVLYGPITIGSGETVRISADSNVKIVDIANV